MRAGFCKRDITPLLGVELAGYGYYLNRRALSLKDPLFVRAVLLESEDIRSLLISCDLLGLSKEVCADVFRHAKNLGIPSEHVMIVSTHTHTGPCIKYHEGCGYVDENYVSGLAGLICQAIDTAVADLSTISAIEQSFSSFPGDHIYNRTIAEGPVDRFVRGFILKRSANPPICLVNAACHGVFNGRISAISADYAGQINKIMEQKGFCAIYFNGLCGDIDPYKATEERQKEFSKIVADAFEAQINSLPISLKAGSIPFTLKLASVTETEIRNAAKHAVELAGGSEKPEAHVALIWEKEMLAKLSRLQNTEQISCKYLLLGGVPIVSFPFEGYTQIGQDIRKIINRPDSVMLGCGEELLGYLPTRDDIAREAYAALEATFLYKRLPVMPGEAERLGQEIGFVLKGVLS